MTRRELRENVFKILFRVDFHEEDGLQEQFDLYMEDIEGLEGVRNSDISYISHKCKDIFSKISEIDEAINACAKGWKTTRMSKMDLAIIRLAVYEIKYEESIPDKVSINEAVELAKQYGTDDSASFVNGILAKFVC